MGGGKYRPSTERVFHAGKLASASARGAADDNVPRGRVFFTQANRVSLRETVRHGRGDGVKGAQSFRPDSALSLSSALRLISPALWRIIWTMIYFDNASTTPVCAAAVQAAAESLSRDWVNPSSLYAAGELCSRRLEAARRTVAASLDARAEEIYFTSGGTEANNLAVLGLARARSAWGRRVVCTGYEHPSVNNAVAALADEGFETVFVKPGIDGTVDADALLRCVDKSTALVTAMGVNNETGAMLDIPRLAAQVKKINGRTAFHCDWVQGYLKQSMSAALSGVDTLSVSGHKINAPKGVGALYVRRGVNMAHTLFGGLQERGVRPGTENLPYALAFAAAVEAHGKDKNAAEVKAAVLHGISRIQCVTINSPDSASEYILNFSMQGYRSETVLHFLEQRGILVSAGSACSKGEPSHTLAAMGVPRRVAESAVRVSFSDENTVEQARIFVAAVEDAAKELVHV